MSREKINSDEEEKRTNFAHELRPLTLKGSPLHPEPKRV